MTQWLPNGDPRPEAGDAELCRICGNPRGDADNDACNFCGCVLCGLAGQRLAESVRLPDDSLSWGECADCGKSQPKRNSLSTACDNYEADEDKPGFCEACEEAWESHDSSFTIEEIETLAGIAVNDGALPTAWEPGDYFCTDYPTTGVVVYSMVCTPGPDEQTGDPGVIVVRSWSKLTGPRGERGAHRISASMSRIDEETFEDAMNNGWAQ